MNSEVSLDDIKHIKVDEGLADILQKVRAAGKKKDKSKNKEVKQDTSDASDNAVESLVDKYNAANIEDDVDTFNAGTLPWFDESDKDDKYLHYIRIDDAGNLVYDKVKQDSTPNSIAALKMKDNYLCDVDYYKNKYNVLFVKQLDSDYPYSRSFVAQTNESLIEVEDTKIIDDSNEEHPELTKTATENISDEVAECDKYYHYVVFTDLGIADFIARADDVSYPYTESDLNKWFEDTSNRVPIKNPRFDETTETVNIPDYKYDIVTMHRPGIFTLDSSDNETQSPIHLQLKDEYSYIPIKNILECLKKYSSDDNKSFEDFKKFIVRYFEFI